MSEPTTEKSNVARGCMIAFFFVIGLLSILVLVGIHEFLNFRKKAKQSEAKTNLGSLYTAQVAYFGEHNTYAGGPDCFDLLGWGPEGDTIYNYFCGADMLEATMPYFSIQAECVNVTPASSKDGFTICATGNVDDDPTVDTWSFRDSKVLINDMNDVRK